MINHPKTTHLDRLTDDFGVWQFFENNQILRAEGYALDDSARAFIVYLIYNKQDKARICLNYLENSYKDGKFIGFWNEHRKPIVYPSSEDAHALAVWALAYGVANNFEKDRCMQLLNKIDMSLIENSSYIRTSSYTLIAYTLHKKQTDAHAVAEKIISRFDKKLQWYEHTLTYANAIIPYSLLTYIDQYKERIDPDTRTNIEIIIKQSIDTLEQYCHIDNIPAPVGSDKWQEIGSQERSLYGQQPIDPGFMVLLLVKAYQYFKDLKYKKSAEDWMTWFYGNNIAKKSLITEDFACADWIKEQGISTNYGSESTIIYLLAQKIYNQLHE